MTRTLTYIAVLIQCLCVHAQIADQHIEENVVDAEVTKALVAGSAPSIGRANAPVTIVEFGDFECPDCKNMAKILEDEVLKDNGRRVRVVFRNFPLSKHPWAKIAAQMATCVTMQNRREFWKIHDFFFEHQDALTTDSIVKATDTFVRSRVVLDDDKFESCVAQRAALPLVEGDIELARAFGIHETPTLFVNGVRLQGSKNAAELDDLILAIRARDRR